MAANRKFRPDERGAETHPPKVINGIVGVSEWAQIVREQIARVARFPSSVLISGPSGTGKELIARAIHDQSQRCHDAFIPVDCTTFSSELFASHMFGHTKGAFTGAQHDSLGCLRAAHGGTVLLDEIGDLEPKFQAKLLRFLESRTVVPLGNAKPIPVDVRVIAATNRDLIEGVQAGRFRTDLFYRLNVVHLRTAPLKHRLEDIEQLAHHFTTSFCENNGLPCASLSAQALQVLQRHNWPGNVRELRNVLERAIVFTEEECLNANSIMMAMSANPPSLVDHSARDSEVRESAENEEDQSAFRQQTASALRLPDNQDKWLTLGELERHHIEATLDHTFFNQTAAAELLGVTRRVLSRLIAKHDIDVSESRCGRPVRGRVRK